MTFLKHNSEIISTIISIIALFLSTYSVIKSNKINRFEITITDVEYEPISNKIRINFSLFNNSIKSILIYKIDFLSTKTKNQYHPVNFDINAYYKQKSEQFKPNLKPKDPLFGDLLSTSDLISSLSIPEYAQSYEYPSETSNLIIKPNEYLNLTYYFDDISFETTIKITANERLTFFSKEKSFSTILIKSN